MKMKLGSAILAMGVAFWLATTTASGMPVVLLDDNFNTENGGVGSEDYSGFTNWTVSNGTVDLVSRPGSGLAVDMDGGDAGKMTSKETFTLQWGSYDLSFTLTNRGTGADTVRVMFGTFVDTPITINNPFSFISFTLSYHYAFDVSSPTQVALSFEGLGGDNAGLLLDNVKFEQTAIIPNPEPGTLLLLGSGLIGLFGYSWRRRKLVA